MNRLLQCSLRFVRTTLSEAAWPLGLWQLVENAIDERTRVPQTAVEIRATRRRFSIVIREVLDPDSRKDGSYAHLSPRPHRRCNRVGPHRWRSELRIRDCFFCGF